MKLIRGIHNLSRAPHGCVLTIGNFDGVHRGHRALLQGLQEEGRRRGLPVMVMIFEPQPLELFATDKAPARLTRLREKLRYLAQCGVDYVLCVRFDRRFAALTAQTFISELLVNRLGVQFLAVGMISALALVAKAISCYYRRLVWNMVSISPAPKPSVKVAFVSAALLCAVRWRRTTRPRRKSAGPSVYHLWPRSAR